MGHQISPFSFCARPSRCVTAAAPACRRLPLAAACLPPPPALLLYAPDDARARRPVLTAASAWAGAAHKYYGRFSRLSLAPPARACVAKKLARVAHSICSNGSFDACGLRRAGSMMSNHRAEGGGWDAAWLFLFCARARCS